MVLLSAVDMELKSEERADSGCQTAGAAGAADGRLQAATAFGRQPAGKIDKPQNILTVSARNKWKTNHACRLFHPKDHSRLSRTFISLKKALPNYKHILHFLPGKNLS